MNKIKYLIPIIVSMIITSCGSKTQEAKPAEEMFAPEFLKSIETYTVTVQNVEQQLKLTGKVDYDPDKFIRYISLANGMVVSTHFNLGDRVEKGRVMAVIRSAELSAMEAERQRLESDIKILARDLESARSMYQDNLSSQKELLEAQGRLIQAEADLDKVKINLSLYGSSGSDGTFIIKSPINGFVVDKNIAPGAQIAAESEPLFTVADISSVWIIANVYAGDLAFVKQGMPVDIKASAYPDKVFQGKIDAMSQVFDSEEHVLKARIVMPNTDLKFKPEMAVDLTLKDSREVQMAAVPSKALIFDDNRHFVVKQTSDHFTVVEVKQYVRTGDTSWLESGVEAGDKIVTKNNLLMYGKLKDTIIQ